MAINNWWADDPSERYWMEITTREDVGSELWAPKRGADGQESWSYSLITYLSPGDHVLHWGKTAAGESAIVGWSTVKGPLGEDTRTWLARGPGGRERGSAVPSPVWTMPVSEYHALDRPVTRSQINAQFREIAPILEAVRLAARGTAYIPFQVYAGKELRATQGYLTKFPSTLVDLLFDSTVPGAKAQELNEPRISRDQGYLRDARARAAVEAHAVAVAISHYRGLGATELEERGKPYDLRVVLDGVERHVEVKGSTGVGLGSVILTYGEVLHAATCQPTDLFVVDEVQLESNSDGEYLASGGRTRLWTGWQPADERLRPTHLRYDLPTPTGASS